MNGFKSFLRFCSLSFQNAFQEGAPPAPPAAHAQEGRPAFLAAGGQEGPRQLLPDQAFDQRDLLGRGGAVAAPLPAVHPQPGQCTSSQPKQPDKPGTSTSQLALTSLDLQDSDKVDDARAVLQRPRRHGLVARRQAAQQRQQ